MKNKPYPKTPELDKLKSVSDESQIIGRFIEEMSARSPGMILAAYDDKDRFWPVTHSIERILAEYFDIDLVRVENERRAILESIR